MVVHIVFDIAGSCISRNQVRRVSTQWCNHPAHIRRKTHVIVPLLDEKLNVFSVPDVCRTILYFKKIRFGVLKIPAESDGRPAGWWYVVELRHTLAAYYRRITARYLVNIYAIVQGRRTYVRDIAQAQLLRCVVVIRRLDASRLTGGGREVAISCTSLLCGLWCAKKVKNTPVY